MNVGAALCQSTMKTHSGQYQCDVKTKTVCSSPEWRRKAQQEGGNWTSWDLSRRLIHSFIPEALLGQFWADLERDAQMNRPSPSSPEFTSSRAGSVCNCEMQSARNTKEKAADSTPGALKLGLELPRQRREELHSG